MGNFFTKGNWRYEFFFLTNGTWYVWKKKFDWGDSWPILYSVGLKAPSGVKGTNIVCWGADVWPQRLQQREAPDVCQGELNKRSGIEKKWKSLLKTVISKINK